MQKFQRGDEVKRDPSLYKPNHPCIDEIFVVTTSNESISCWASSSTGPRCVDTGYLLHRSVTQIRTDKIDSLLIG